MPELRHGQARIPYQVVVSKGRTTIGIVVDRGQGVVVRTPRKLTAHQMEQIVESKASWILKQLAKIETLQPPVREFINGEGFPYLGETYPLKVCPARVALAQARLEGHTLVVHLPHGIAQEQRQAQVRAALEAWYMAQAKEMLPGRVAAFGELVGRQPVRVSVRSPQLRWGSCAANGNINLNWRILMAPPTVVDYVAAHEVCHLQEHNHSAAFWRLVGTIMPGYQEHKEWLRVNGHRLVI